MTNKVAYNRMSLRITIMHSYHISNELIPSPATVRNLGILVHTKLIVFSAFRSITAKADTRCCLIFKCFLSNDPVFLCRAFVVYVRPLLEDASCTGSPHNVSGITMVEAGQRKFTQKGFERCQTLTKKTPRPS